MSSDSQLIATNELAVAGLSIPIVPVLSKTANVPLPSVRIRSETRGVAGLHHVRMRRARQDFVQTFFIDDNEAAARFVEEATDHLLLPGECREELRVEIKRCIASERQDYEEFCDHLVLETMDMASACPVEWLWPGYIGANKLAMLVGEPGVGKSLVALDIAARVSTGRPWPDEPPTSHLRQPGSVLLLSETDDSQDTLRPRLQALDADMKQIVMLKEFVRTTNGKREVVPFSVGGNLKMLQQAIERVRNCRLIIIDPLSAYVDGQYTRRDLNSLLQDLIELAIANDLAILALSHFSRGNSLFHTGSSAHSRFCAGARSVWKIVGDPSHRDRRVILPMKNNLGADWLGLAFRIETAVDDPVPRVKWENSPLEVKINRSNYKEVSQPLPNGYEVRRKAVNEWLRGQLMGGERFIQDVIAEAALARIGQRSLRRALREVGTSTRKVSTGVWVWALSDKSSSDSNSDDENQCQESLSKHRPKSIKADQS